MFAIVVIVLIILLTIGIVWVIDKFVPKKAKPFINIILWVLIFVLGYMTFMSVYREIKFNQLKETRYKSVINQLSDIRDSQVVYKKVNGEYADKFEKLIRFIDTAKVPITQRRDTTVKDIEASRRYSVDMVKTITLTDTLGHYSVKDSLFKNDNRYKTMMNVYQFNDAETAKDYDSWVKDLPNEYTGYSIDGKSLSSEDIKQAVAKFDDVDEYLTFLGKKVGAKEIKVNDIKNLSQFFNNQKFKDEMLEGKTYSLVTSKIDDIPVFEVSLNKSTLFYDQERYLVEKEKKVKSVEGVNGPKIQVGSLEEISTNGNWPKTYSKE